MISVYPSVYDRWRWIVKEFTEKSKFTQTSMKAAFLNSKCPDKSDVRKFLDALRIKKEELITYGIHVSDEDFLSTIIKSLPQYLSHFASNLLANARLWSATGTIDPHRFIAIVSEEYDRTAIIPASKNGGNGGGGNGGGKGKGKWRRKKKDLSDVTCWCCKKKVEDDDSDGINLFAAVKDEGSLVDGDVGEMSREEWEEALDKELWELWTKMIFEGYENDSEDEDFEAVYYDGPNSRPTTPITYSVSTSQNNNNIRVTFYDSGSTPHITPYRENLYEFQATPPYSLRAANQGSFDATGIGKIDIDVPNGTETSKIQLTDVLYSPEVGYSLVSIGQLDEMGYTCTFGKGRCIIEDPDGVKVGEVWKNVREGDRAKEFGDEVHSDLWGPAPVETLRGKKYYVSFIDDKTRLTSIHFLRAKSDTFEAYKEYEACQGEDKLDERAKEVRWLGLDEKLKGVRVYWPGQRKVSMERNVYYDKSLGSTHSFEGENWHFKTKVSDPNVPSTSLNPPLDPPSIPTPPSPISESNQSQIVGNEQHPTPPIPDEVDNLTSPPQTQQTEPRRGTRVRNPGPLIQEMLAGQGTHSPYKNRDGQLPRGVHIPGSFEGEEEEANEIEEDWFESVMVGLSDEVAMAATMEEEDALEPRTIAEAKRRRDWPMWQKAIVEELETLKRTGTWELVDYNPMGYD
ncbi:hypothetical protein CVT24_000950 [Panaeolus cyanescens]|uniref:Retrotransposon gag domain-containing protein n=1 Tax=Panaeolus cyanescens TaxID=181874 RepID=A0A409YCI2_9AGAR|nr:hypothetical protein CVT24_000950 [Panaeolus cyanescens]